MVRECLNASSDMTIKMATAAKATDYIDRLPPELLERVLLEVVDDVHPPLYFNSSGYMRTRCFIVENLSETLAFRSVSKAFHRTS
jgi:hypothetical protein